MELRSFDSMKTRIAVLLIVPTLLYWQDFYLLGKEAINSDLSTHIIIIPFLIAYMVYRLRNVVRSSILFHPDDVTLFNIIPSSDLIGILLFTLSYIIKWYGSYSFHPLEYHIASIPIMVFGLILLLFNKQTLKALIFPVMFLIFLIPPPIEFAQQTGAYLAVISANFSYLLLKVLGFPVILNNQYDAPIIYLERATGEVIPFAIDIACSGLYSFIGLIVFAMFFSYISQGSLRKKIAVLLASFPIIYVTNIIRITIIILVGFYMGTGYSLNLFHLLSGWILIFIGTLIILTLAEKLFNIKIFQQTIESCTHQTMENRNTCLQCGMILRTPGKNIDKNEAIKLISILLTTIIVLSIQVPVFALSTGQPELLDPNIDVKTVDVLPDIEGYDLNFVYRDTEFEKISRQNASMWYKYDPLDYTKQSVWVGLEVASTRSNLHNWEICLVVMPARVNRYTNIKVDLRDIHLLDNPPLTARYFAYHRDDSNVTEVILYWYTESVFETDNGLENLLTKISVVQYVSHPLYYKMAEEEIHPIGLAIANYWRPVSTWSSIGVSIARNGKPLIALIVIVLSSILALIISQNRRRERYAKKIEDELTDPRDISLIAAVKQVTDKPAKQEEIAKKYMEITEKTIPDKELYEKLVKAEEIGLLRSQISNINNIPYRTWRSATDARVYTIL
ncbi:exosortase/archaeosortase family protein [Thermoproteota archaeon]